MCHWLRQFRPAEDGDYRVLIVKISTGRASGTLLVAALPLGVKNECGSLGRRVDWIQATREDEMLEIGNKIKIRRTVSYSFERLTI